MKKNLVMEIYGSASEAGEFGPKVADFSVYKIKTNKLKNVSVPLNQSVI